MSQQIDKQKSFKLTITSQSIVSTDERFTVDNLALGDKYVPVDAYFISAEGKEIRRKRQKNENVISNMTLPRLACQIYERQLEKLSPTEKEHFPIYRLNSEKPVICGIYSSVEEFEKHRNKFESLSYKTDEGVKFVFYSWNVFSTLLFVQECLKRFGEKGDKFIFEYKEKSANMDPYNDYWPSEEDYSPNITKDDWKKYIEMVEKPNHRECMKMLKGIIELGGEASCKRLSSVYGGSPTKYVGYAVNMGKRAKRFFDLDPCIDREDNQERFFPVMFLGRRVVEDGDTYYSYKIRNELFEALKEVDLGDIVLDKYENADVITVGGTNQITYGAPGCGKSHEIRKRLEKCHVQKCDIIRVTFHPEYANSDFVGQIMPHVERNDGETIVTYQFNPGPFAQALERAYRTNNMVYLIIEEINRGNAAAIFGDTFQLLDRIKDSDDPNYSSSEYPISNPNLLDYIMDGINKDVESGRIPDSVDIDRVIERLSSEGIYIPCNLTILATMNSSDQNVFTLDTAFKRRWSFEQISNDIENDADHPYKNWYVPGTDVTWGSFLTKLNDRILDNKIQNQTNEDKRLGKFFVSTECLTKDIEDIANVHDAAMNFAYKVLEYVWNDVCKIGRDEWFDIEQYRTLEDLISGFISGEGLSVFQNIDFRNDD